MYFGNKSILFLCGEGCACKQKTTTEKAKEKKRNEKRMKIMKLKSNQIELLDKMI